MVGIVVLVTEVLLVPVAGVLPPLPEVDVEVVEVDDDVTPSGPGGGVVTASGAWPRSWATACSASGCWT